MRVFSLNSSIYGYSRCHKLYFVHTKHIRCCRCVCVCLNRCANKCSLFVVCWLALDFSLPFPLFLFLLPIFFSLPPDVCCFRFVCKPKYTIQFRLNHHHHTHIYKACVRSHASLIYQTSKSYSSFFFVYFYRFQYHSNSHWFIFYIIFSAHTFLM